MSLPSPLYIWLDSGVYMSIEGALSQSTKNAIIFGGDTYRDELDAGFLGNAHGEVAARATEYVEATTNPTIVVAEGHVAANYPFIAGGIAAPAQTSWPVIVPFRQSTTSYAPGRIADTHFDQSDSYTHVAPRQRAKIHSLFRWWNNVSPGIQQTMTGGTTNGSATVTVPGTETLEVGQLVGGAGIPSGARIAMIRPIMIWSPTSGTPVTLYPTEIVLSHKATATADAELTFTGGDMLGQCWVNEFLVWSKSIPVRI